MCIALLRLLKESFNEPNIYELGTEIFDVKKELKSVVMSLKEKFVQR